MSPALIMGLSYMRMELPHLTICNRANVTYKYVLHGANKPISGHDVSGRPSCCPAHPFVRPRCGRGGEPLVPGIALLHHQPDNDRPNTSSLVRWDAVMTYISNCPSSQRKTKPLMELGVYLPLLT
jgi:hypothetical protein